jgi:hypothetical protein
MLRTGRRCRVLDVQICNAGRTPALRVPFATGSAPSYALLMLSYGTEERERRGGQEEQSDKHARRYNCTHFSNSLFCKEQWKKDTLVTVYRFDGDQPEPGKLRALRSD